MYPVDAKILIVDDSTFARTVLKNGLRDLKFWKIVEADGARAAKSILLEDEQKLDPIHLMVVDVHMPEMSGLDLLRWVRQQDRFRAMPVIILTTVQEKGGILEAGKLGVSHYMIKPFDTDTLRERISSTWEKHGQKYFADVMKKSS